MPDGEWHQSCRVRILSHERSLTRPVVRHGICSDGVGKSFLFTGFFGAYTTMSTFSIDTVNLLVDEAYAKAGANILMNSVLCVIGAVCGRWLALL